MFSTLANDRSRRHGSPKALVLAGIFLLVLTTGCGDGDKTADESAADRSVVIATVGDTEITSDYYEGRLAKLKPEELPRENDVALDMATEAGKRAFLDILINKELMVLKAKALGYDQEAAFLDAREKLIAYEADDAMWKKFVQEAGNFISDEELAEFYENMGTEYRCEYLITNYEEEALAARQAALDGADWEEVTAEYHRGKAPANGVFKVSIPYGHYSPYFEAAVFATEKGGITMPIKSDFGYWVLRVVEIIKTRKPDLAGAKAKILDGMRNRKVGSSREMEQQRLLEAYEMNINEDALWDVYEALPLEGLMDPETNQPYSRDKLKPLNVKSSDLDQILFSYRDDAGVVIEMTVAEYAEKFNNMSVFQRPRKNEMLGSLRVKLLSDVAKAVAAMEARKKGFYTDPQVLEKVDLKMEEMLVNRLFQEVVSYDDKVDVEEMKALWKEVQDDYKMPESRSGHQVVCRDLASAEKARAALAEGNDWRSVIARFDVDAQNKKQGGMTGQLNVDSESPTGAVLFHLDVNEISEPFPYNGKLFAVAKLEAITAAKEYEFDEVTEALGGRIKRKRQDAAFKALLAEWSDEFGVQIYSETLPGLKSYEELVATTPVDPATIVPRS